MSQRRDSNASRNISGLTISTEDDPPSNRWEQFKDFVHREATFFRVHVVVFVTLPLVFSGIFYACNGQYRIEFIDSLFLCYSAMTVTGLSTVNLSTLTAWQQVILYLLMMVGDITMVSWVMVLVRKEYFKSKCEYVVTKHKSIFTDRETFLAAISSPIAAFRPANIISPKSPNPPPALNLMSPTPAHTLPNEKEEPDDIGNIISDVKNFSSSPNGNDLLLSPVSSPARGEDTSPTSRAIAFSTGVSQSPRPAASRLDSNQPRVGGRGVPLGRRTNTFHTTYTTRTARSRRTLPPEQEKYTGMGGFPGPFQIIQKLLKQTAPKTYLTLERKLTLPFETTEKAENKPWLSFDLHVGRNSDFHVESLSDEQVEEIGGTEYKALRLLSYLVPIYFIGTQLFAFLIFGPWISVTHGYDDVFDAQPREVKKPWFSLFQVMGAYTGGGLSLVDLGMVPFQDAYPMIFALMFAILAGNHALPIFLRFIIWVSFKFSTPFSETHRVLSFLLDHPRRCFVYLFPSHQTWFLVFCLLLFSAIEWVGFEALNVGLPIYTSLSTGPRIVDGLFQGLAARASGFSIIAISALAPALQFLYVVMMYIAVYPVALSIRATNVYEERSLGIFEEPPDNEDEEPADLGQLEPRQRIGRYLGWHLRRQLSNDIWWLVWGVFLVAVIERHNLLDDSKKWFDLFHVLFELVSAFGGIGLSLGFPYDNYSFAGAMQPLSKLVIIVIMVRGRHRGLPVAVDRAVLLPSELILQRTMRTAGLKRPDPQISSMP